MGNREKVGKVFEHAVSRRLQAGIVGTVGIPAGTAEGSNEIGSKKGLLLMPYLDLQA